MNTVEKWYLERQDQEKEELPMLKNNEARKQNISIGR